MRLLIIFGFTLLTAVCGGKILPNKILENVKISSQPMSIVMDQNILDIFENDVESVLPMSNEADSNEADADLLPMVDIMDEHISELLESDEANDNQVQPMSAIMDERVQEQLEDETEEIEIIPDPKLINGPEPRFIVSWQLRRFIRKLRKQMPCGWEKYGIPPLAPLKVYERDVHLKQGLLETIDSIFHFRVDGLDDFKIKKFKLNMITSKVKFDFIFRNVKASAENYDTDTIFDAFRQLGLFVEYEGNGSFEFGLRNLRVAGVLHYKMPVLWGSIRIKSLKTQVSLEKCESSIQGLLGEGGLNRFVNRQIEKHVEASINNNQAEISDKIERTLVPKVNRLLKGNDFWTLVDYILSSNENEDDPIVVKCVPPKDPWA